MSVLLRTQSDERLVALARAGHERAFEAIVQRYRPLLVRSARRYLSDARAEDAVQQAFLSAWSALQRGDDVRELRPWLYRIVHNTALNALGAAGYDHAELPDSVPVRGSELERRMDVHEALSGLAALPERQREALLRVAVEGRPQTEVAAELGVSEGAVRQLVHRARMTLRAAATAVTPLPFVTWAAAATGGAAGAGAAATSGAGGLAAKVGAVAVIATTAVAVPVVVREEPRTPVAGRTATPSPTPTPAPRIASPAVTRTPTAEPTPQARRRTPPRRPVPTATVPPPRRPAPTATVPPPRATASPRPAPTSTATATATPRREPTADATPQREPTATATAPAAATPTASPHTYDEPRTDNSGPGSGSSGSGSSGSGPDNSGPGSGSSGSGSSGSDDSGSGSSGHGDQ
jgi:RNA polymerase sigma factor (sigma-70 family)